VIPYGSVAVRWISINSLHTPLLFLLFLLVLAQNMPILHAVVLPEILSGETKCVLALSGQRHKELYRIRTSGEWTGSIPISQLWVWGNSPCGVPKTLMETRPKC